MKFIQHTPTDIDRDTDKYKFNKDSVYYLKNASFLENGNNLSITNIEGTKEITIKEDPDSIGSNLQAGTTYTVKGSTGYKNATILFLKNSINLLIVALFDEGGEEYKIYEVYQEVLNLIGFDDNSKVEGIVKYINSDKINLYFFDETSKLKLLDISEEKDYTSLNSLDPKELSILSDPDFVTPEFVQYSSGSISLGVVQYAYRLINKKGVPTSFSPASNMIPISKDINKESLNSVSGADSGDLTQDLDSGVGVKIRIDMTVNNMEKSNFKYIEIVRLWYSDEYAVPSIRIISKYEIENLADNLEFVDYGSNVSYDTITYEEFLTSIREISGKHLSAENNRLIVTNTSEEYFDVDKETDWVDKNSGDSWESRVLRFRSGTAKSVVKDYNHGYSNLEFNSGVTLSSLGPDDHDFVNSYNEEVNPVPDDTYKFIQNLTKLGGTGTNIELSFTQEAYRSDKSSNVEKDVVEIDKVFDNGTEDQKNIIGINKQLKRNEIYRLSIIFYHKGRKSIPKWMGDIKTPDAMERIWDDNEKIAIVKNKDNYTPYLYSNRYQPVETEYYVGTPVSDFSGVWSDSEFRTLIVLPSTGEEKYWDHSNKRYTFNGKDYYVGEVFYYTAGQEIDNTNSNGARLAEIYWENLKFINLYFRIKVNNLPKINGASLNYQIFYTPRTDQNSVNKSQALICPIEKNTDSSVDFYNVSGQNTSENFNLRVGYSPEITLGLPIRGSHLKRVSPDQRGSDATRKRYKYSTSDDLHTTKVYKGLPTHLSEDAEDTYTYGSMNTTIDDSTILGPGQQTTIKGKSFKNYYYDIDHIAGESGRSIILGLGSTVNQFPFFVADILSNVYPYQGSTYEARKFSDYVPFSPVIRGNKEGVEVTIKSGDTVISWFPVIRSLFNSTFDESTFDIFYVGLESKYNFNLATHKLYNSLLAHTDNSSLEAMTRPELAQTINGDYLYKDESLIDLNKVYSAYPKNYITKVDQDIDYDTFSDDTKIIASKRDAGLNSYIDNWLIFPYDNINTVSSNLGPITGLVSKQSLFVLQTNGISILPVDVQISSEGDGQTVLSQGPVLGNPVYLSQEIGLNEGSLPIISETAIYIVDQNRKIIVGFNKESFTDLTNKTSLKSYLKKNIKKDHEIVGGYDKNTGDLFFTFKSPNQSIFYLTHNEELEDSYAIDPFGDEIFSNTLYLVKDRGTGNSVIYNGNYYYHNDLFLGVPGKLNVDSIDVDIEIFSYAKMEDKYIYDEEGYNKENLLKLSYLARLRNSDGSSSIRLFNDMDTGSTLSFKNTEESTRKEDKDFSEMSLDDDEFTLVFNEPAGRVKGIYDMIPDLYINTKNDTLVFKDGLHNIYKGERNNFFGKVYPSVIVFISAPGGLYTPQFMNMSLDFKRLKDGKFDKEYDNPPDGVVFFNSQQNTGYIPLFNMKSFRATGSLSEDPLGSDDKRYYENLAEPEQVLVSEALYNIRKHRNKYNMYIPKVDSYLEGYTEISLPGTWNKDVLRIFNNRLYQSTTDGNDKYPMFDKTLPVDRYDGDKYWRYIDNRTFMQDKYLGIALFIDPGTNEEIVLDSLIVGYNENV